MPSGKLARVLSPLLRSYFPVFFLIALTIYGMQVGEVPLPLWINFYVNDFLCMPIVLFLCRYVIRMLKSDATLPLPFGPVIALTLLYAIYFEGLLPEYNPRYTGDVFDVLLYFLGSGFFLIVQHLRLRRMMESR
ncbi:MAG: hypothetical protein WA913_12600 [Pricia sp.]